MEDKDPTKERGFDAETCCVEIDAVTEDMLEDGDVGREGVEVSEEEELGRVRPLPKIAFGDSCCGSLRAASGRRTHSTIRGSGHIFVDASSAKELSRIASRSNASSRVSEGLSQRASKRCWRGSACFSRPDRLSAVKDVDDGSCAGSAPRDEDKSLSELSPRAEPLADTFSPV